MLVGADVLTEHGTVETGRVVIRDGAIADQATSKARVVDLSSVRGAVVVPGLVDLHVHVFRGQDAGREPDLLGAQTGVTTMLDAGSAGAHLFDAFRITTIDTAETRVRAMINVATIGITSFQLRGELADPAYLDAAALKRAVERHRDVIVGVKVRASSNVGGSAASDALRFARLVADDLGLPLMVHLGPAPAAVDEILSTLRGGDILTHCFSGWPQNDLLGRDGLPRPAVLDARERGIVFDLGYGQSSFDPEVARTLLSTGFAPDTISSDVHAYSTRIGGLPVAMNAMRALGLSLPEVLVRTTHAPAGVLGLNGVGRLLPGESPADVAVLADEPRPWSAEGTSTTLIAPSTLEPVLTIRAGRVVHDPRGLTGLAVGPVDF